MPEWFTFVLLTLACYRVWRLVGKDDITAPLRVRLPSIVVQGVSCNCCAGTWISLVGVWLADRYVIALSGHWLLWAVAVSCAVCLLDGLDGD